MNTKTIPTEKQAKQLWDTYNVPENKRRHLLLVSRVAEFLARRLMAQSVSHVGGNHQAIVINTQLLVAAALLHDIDKNIEKLPGERHPDTAVRVLCELGMNEVASLVKKHSLHMINDPKTAPKSWEEKVLFLADKMVKYDVITVDKRFDLWQQEAIPEEGRQQLEMAYPKVKALEHEIFTILSLDPSEVARLVEEAYT
jgi:HD superfamily phosphodiesterase